MGHDCPSCNRDRRFVEIINTLSEEDQKFMMGVLDDLMNAEDDLGYKRAVLNGDWPQSVEILEVRLISARKKAGIKPSEAPEEIRRAAESFALARATCKEEDAHESFVKLMKTMNITDY